MFYFAWVEENTTFDPDVHAVEDEKIVALTVSHTEGEFASLDITIKNPRVGLLNATRKQWAWLSWHNGTEIVPLFYGRLVGIPNDIHLETVLLVFTAQPSNYAALKAAYADTLRVLPFYDPVFVDEDARSDPDIVLDARADLWYIDRVTHDVGISNLLVGEDGEEEFLASEVPYESVAVQFGEPPLRSVAVSAKVSWTQAGRGVVGLRHNAHYKTYTGDGLISDWPKTNSSLGGGWVVTYASAKDAAGIETRYTENSFQINGSFSDLPFPSDWIAIPTIYWAFGPSVKTEGVLVPLWDVVGNLIIGYDVEREYNERIEFTLDANVQPIITLAGDAEIGRIDLNGVDVGVEIDGVAPIENVLRSQYFTTDRGLQSVAHLIARARALLLARSRAVDVTFECPFARAVNLTLRKNARLHDSRLPGGTALGKIKSYSFFLEAGRMAGKVTIACSVGYGDAVNEVEGDPVYVENGYVEAGYQEYANKLVVLEPGDVGYTLPGGAPNDDGLKLINGLRARDIVVAQTVTNLYQAQRAIAAGVLAIGMSTKDVLALIKERLKTVGTRIHMQLKPVEGGPFETVYNIQTTMLEIPKMIDLEASSSQ